MSSFVEPTQPSSRERAGFWRRFAAALIDGLALLVVGEVLRAIGIGGSTHGSSVHIVGGYGSGLLVSLVYFTYFHGRTGQTPGDAALGIKVVDLRGGATEPIGYGRAAVRWVISIVSVIPIGLGYFWMLWDSEKQTWHDKAAGSVVVLV